MKLGEDSRPPIAHQAFSRITQELARILDGFPAKGRV